MGNLVRTQTFKLELANNSTALVRGAVTVYWLKPGGILDVELLGGTVAAVDVEIPRRASRVIYAVSPAPNSHFVFKLSQGLLAVEETVTRAPHLSSRSWIRPDPPVALGENPSLHAAIQTRYSC